MTETESALSDLAREVAELKDLFLRRLLEDKDKRRLIDQLQEQLAAERQPFRQYLHPVVRELALVIDRVDGYAGGDPSFAVSVRDELLELLDRLGVQEVPTDVPFDPTRHEMARAVHHADQADHVIAEVLARGYRHGDWVFRPARVVVNLAPPDPA